MLLNKVYIYTGLWTLYYPPTEDIYFLLGAKLAQVLEMACGQWLIVGCFEQKYDNDCSALQPVSQSTPGI